MLTHRALLVLLPFLLTTALGCRGCSSDQGMSWRAPTEASAPEASTLQPDSGDIDEFDPPFGRASADSSGAAVFEIVGEPDAHNRYPSVVMVRAQLPASGARLRECSGVIVAPRLVLTAGHCVCRRRQVSVPRGGLEHRVDGAACAEAAIVTVFFYEHDPRDPRQIVGSISAQHPGRVRPHPRMEVRLDMREGILSSHADLATIFLDTPVPVGFRPVRLARTRAVPGETLTRVGFGYDDALGALDGRRLMHESKVLKALAPGDGRFLLEEADGYIFSGDDGGPCLRETRKRPELVGISTTGLGQEPAMTSMFPYWEWLRDEISLAASSEEPREPGAVP